jgi:hypothetical protein
MIDKYELKKLNATAKIEKKAEPEENAKTEEKKAN